MSGFNLIQVFACKKPIEGLHKEELIINKNRVVIVGGGFAGLEAAKALRSSNAEIILIDRRNYHLFQPLLYQVATAGLSPASIAAPIRHILSNQKNTSVVMGEVKSIDLIGNQIFVEGQSLSYDFLVLATGAETNYFGNDWSKSSPGLKTLAEALKIRSQFLLSFESAEVDQDKAEVKKNLTFTIVGGGPTGVELAGAITEMAQTFIQSDFRHINSQLVKVVLIDSGERLLSSFDKKLSEKAKADLEKLGVEVRLGCRVTGIEDETLFFTSMGKESSIHSKHIIWAAGVKPSKLVDSLGVELKKGRVLVEPDLSLKDHANVYAVGDLAFYIDPKTKKEVPGVAQGAMQMGKFVGQMIDKKIRSNEKISRSPIFNYNDKGSMAIIGQYKAIAEIGRLKFSGLIAFVLWSFGKRSTNLIFFPYVI